MPRAKRDPNKEYLSRKRSTVPVSFRGQPVNPYTVDAQLAELRLREIEEGHVETYEEANNFDIPEGDDIFPDHVTVFEMRDEQAEIERFNAAQPEEPVPEEAPAPVEAPAEESQPGS